LLPCIVPCAVIQRIADVVVCNRHTVEFGQQIAPVGIAIGISNRIDRTAEGSGGVGIFLLAGDVTRCIVGPGPRLPCLLIVLTNQLIGGVVNITGGT
jgi:hypothetical protein